MNKTFFTSDTHFNHKNILRFCPNRGCKSLDEMHEKIIESWNNKIDDSDTVYHLGDVAFGRPKDSIPILKRLNGKKILIQGNHDTPRYIKEFMYHDIFKEIVPYKEISIDKTPFILFHFPIMTWHRKHYGSVHLYGHTHQWADIVPGKAMNVGVDQNETMAPFSVDEIRNLLKDKEI